MIIKIFFSLNSSKRDWDIYRVYLISKLNSNINYEKIKILDLLIHLFKEINDEIPELKDNKIHWFLIDKKRYYSKTYKL